MRTSTPNSFEIHELKNLTSDLLLVNDSNKIEILECAEQSVTFQTQKLNCSVAQLISLAGILCVNNQSMKFSVVGKISGLERIGDSHKVTIKLNQYDKALWTQFVAALAAKQDNVDKLLTKIKGHE